MDQEMHKWGWRVTAKEVETLAATNVKVLGRTNAEKTALT